MIKVTPRPVRSLHARISAKYWSLRQGGLTLNNRSSRRVRYQFRYKLSVVGRQRGSVGLADLAHAITAFPCACDRPAFGASNEESPRESYGCSGRGSQGLR